jgi:hypothetical protein
VCLARKAARFLKKRERESEITNDVRPAYPMAASNRLEDMGGGFKL